MLVKLSPRIEAAKGKLALHGDLWLVEKQTDTHFFLRSYDMTLRYAKMFMTYQQMVIPKDGGELFNIVEEVFFTPPAYVDDNDQSFPILRKLLGA